MDNEKFYFDTKAADLAVRFIEDLKHYQGKWAGKKFILEDWQKEIVRDIFGWKRTQDGLRKIREVYLETPRKSGKTTLAAAIALFCLVGLSESGASIYSVAADTKQAEICMTTAKRFVMSSKMLSKYAKIFRRSITIDSTASSYQVVSADASLKHGANLSAAILDELHCFPNRDLYDVIKTSTASRDEPLIINITTAGWDRNSICYELHDYAMKCIDGTIEDDEFYPVIFAAGEKDDWKDPKVWAAAQPNLGITVSHEYYEKQCSRAKESLAYCNTFRRLLLSQWTTQATRFLDMDRWQDVEPFDTSKLNGLECYGGLDLASTTDVAALVLAFKMPKYDGQEDYDDSLYVMPYFWIPEDSAEQRERRDRVPYVTWTKQGFIKMTPGNVIDYDYIRKDINELKKRFNIKEIGCDRWNSTQLQTQLASDGIEIVPFGQGHKSMSTPVKEIEKLVLSKKLRHNGNPVLRWMASNVFVVVDSTLAMKIDKKRSTEKVDGIVALAMAIGRMQTAPESSAYTAYNKRGILIL